MLDRAASRVQDLGSGPARGAHRSTSRAGAILEELRHRTAAPGPRSRAGPNVWRRPSHRIGGIWSCKRSRPIPRDDCRLESTGEEPAVLDGLDLGPASLGSHPDLEGGPRPWWDARRKAARLARADLRAPACVAPSSAAPTCEARTWAGPRSAGPTFAVRCWRRPAWPTRTSPGRGCRGPRWARRTCEGRCWRKRTCGPHRSGSPR